jgi:hypothetical protein
VPFDRVGGCGAALREPLLELDEEPDLAEDLGRVVVVVPEEPAFGTVVADAPSPSDPEVSVTSALAEGACGRARRMAKSPVAPAAATTSHLVIRFTRSRCRSRCRGEKFTPPGNARKL